MIFEAKPPLTHSTPAQRWGRERVAEALSARKTVGAGLSERAFAAIQKIPPSTLRYWRRRTEKIEGPDGLKAFFESPDGLAFLHRLLVAAHVVITLTGGNGVRLVCTFIQLCGLGPYVATSLSAQQRFNLALEQQTVEFGALETTRLGANMPCREITVAQDETFHPQTCLVAIEPDSGFILLEQYEPKRDRDTWDRVMAQACKHLNVKIIQTVSDQATALISHAVVSLKVGHSPDIFHVLHELFKATALSLASKLRAASREFEEQAAKVAMLTRRADDARQDPQRLDSLQKIEAFVLRAVELKELASQRLVQFGQWRLELTQAIRNISDVYHPYSLTNSSLQTSEDLLKSLDALFQRIRELAKAVKLPQRSFDSIDKAYRVVPEMVKTLTFVHATIDKRLADLDLPPEIVAVLRHQLIPAFYLKRAAAKARGADRRKALRKLAKRGLEQAWASGSPLENIDPRQREGLERFCDDCASLFQRSSSCVEGRNGYLALFHHGLHRLSDRRLNALTVIHNFFITDSQGHTPANLFFALPHDSLFEHLLKTMPMPPRPAAKRPKKTDEMLN